MKQFLVLLMAMTYLHLTPLHCADLKTVQKNGKLRIAVDTTYPPMEFEDNAGNIIGLDVDLARELASQLKVKAEFVAMPWEGILAGLQSDRYDIIMSSMNITPERSQQVNFVPYLKLGQVFVTKKGSLSVKNEAQLKGRIVAVQADTTSSTALENISKKYPIKEIKAFKGATEAFAAIKSNQAEVILIDEPVGRYYASLDPNTFTITGEAISPEPIGVAIRKADSTLYKEITAAIKKMKDTKALQGIYKKWLKTEPLL